jgi:Flp pilus assembly protein TadG
MEFSIAGVFFLSAVFGIVEFSRLLWTHNALTDAVRKGARYASIAAPNSQTAVKNMVVYGNTAGGTDPVVTGLTTSHVNVVYSGGFDTKHGSVSVTISGYSVNLNIPFVTPTVTMPAYKASAVGESAGRVPGNI